MVRNGTRMCIRPRYSIPEGTENFFASVAARAIFKNKLTEIPFYISTIPFSRGQRKFAITLIRSMYLLLGRISWQARIHRSIANSPVSRYKFSNYSADYGAMAGNYKAALHWWQSVTLDRLERVFTMPSLKGLSCARRNRAISLFAISRRLIARVSISPCEIRNRFAKHRKFRE